MSKAGLIVLIGFLVVVLPFVGIPAGAKTTLAVMGGILVMALGILLREERRLLMRALEGEHMTDAYTENSAKGYESASPKDPSA